MIRERIAGRSLKDQNDANEVLPGLFSTDQQTREAAERAINQIFDDPVINVAGMTIPPANAKMTRWLNFFATALKKARKEAGLTQQELAAKAGIPQSHVSRLENAEHSPNAMTRQKLATALGVGEGMLEMP